MEIQYFGGNAIRIASKKSSVVVDDNLLSLGQKVVTTGQDISLRTSHDITPAKESYFSIDTPGEYEILGVSIHGIAARAFDGAEGTFGATMYRIISDDVRIAVTGHVHPDLSDDQLEALGTIDILFVPAGGNGYTLDGLGALKVIKKIEPKIVILTHYADKGLKYSVAQDDLETAIKNLAIEPTETLDSLKLKNLDFSDITKLIILNRV